MISRTDAEKLNNPDAFLEYIGLQSFNFPETLVEVAGIELAGAGGSTPANKRVSVHSTEASIKILN
jgi:hypothetical protein